MPLKKTIIILGTLLIAGCSSASSTSTPHHLSMSDIRSIQLGHDRASDLRRKFGEPNDIFPLNALNEIWTFQDLRRGILSDRATFRVEKNGGLVLGSVWFPDESSECSHEQEAIHCFQESQFSKTTVEPIAGHEGSNELDYRDSKTGVGFRVNRISKKVSAFYFSATVDQRTPAVSSQQN